MNQILIYLSNFFHLEQKLVVADLVLIFFTVLLSALSFYFLFVGKEEASEIKESQEDKSNKQTIEQAESPKPSVEEVETLSWDKRLFKGLAKTRGEVWSKIGNILGSKALSDDVVDELEEILFTSDLSSQIVDELLEELKSYKAEESSDYLGFIKSFLKSKMQMPQDKVNKDLYTFDKNNKSLKVIMIVGVNGAGKTTTIGKLATKLKSQGANVVVGACDTFRAAAVEQLEVWCKRAGVDIVKGAENADPTGVAFDAVKKAKELGADYCIIDTAGRLHTKSNLMDELAKTKKVMSKVVEEAPHETLLVVDAITGQNALRQAQEFNATLNLTGLIFTKCDGSSKAGSAVSIVKSLEVPIVYIGVGEDVEDLDIFNLETFLDALLGIEA